MTTTDKLNKQLDDLWDKFLPQMQSRIETIQLAIEALQQNRLNHEIRLAAKEAAHKLAGSLGTFGLQKGSDAAAEIQKLLSENGALGSVELGRIQQLVKWLRRDTEDRLPSRST
jgi:HPt (histidine-containing phosphotransfer) domain-containing protein